MQVKSGIENCVTFHVSFIPLKGHVTQNGEALICQVFFSVSGRKNWNVKKDEVFFGFSTSTKISHVFSIFSISPRLFEKPTNVHGP